MKKLKEKTSKEAFLEYLFKVFEKHDIFSFEEIKYMFLLAINDYLDGKININAFSSIATQLYYTLKKPSRFNINNDVTITGNMLDIASELEWNINNNDKNNSDFMIEKLQKYLDENKYSIITGDLS